MTDPIKRIVRVGTWLYDGTVVSRVQIVQQNFFETIEPEEDEPPPSYPPRDEDGNFYYAEYFTPGAGKGVSTLFGSADDAAHGAEKTRRSPIKWGPNSSI